MGAMAALERAGLKPYAPRSKEGLALGSTNAVSVASAALLLSKTFRLFYVLIAVLGASSAGFAACRQPWRVAENCEGGQISDVAQFVMDAFSGDVWEGTDRVHDPLSFRCAMLVHGTMLEELMRVGSITRDAMKASDDNPIVLDGELIFRLCIFGGGQKRTPVLQRSSAASVTSVSAAGNAINAQRNEVVSAMSVSLPKLAELAIWNMAVRRPAADALSDILRCFKLRLSPPSSRVE